MNHPITPPPELIEEWAHLFVDHTDAEVFSAVARWGANQELKACVTYVAACGKHVLSDSLRSARRPKPPSLKESALNALEHILRPRVGAFRYCVECLHWSSGGCGFGFPEAGDTFATECSVFLASVTPLSTSTNQADCA